MKQDIKLKAQGFTLLELVVVVAVLGLIASLATEFMVEQTNQQRYEITKKKRNTIRTAMHRYYADIGSFPSDLKQLVECSGCTNWKGPYLLDVDFEENTAVYRDGWGTASGAVTADVNYGWYYTNSSGTVYLKSFGLDGSSGTVSASGSVEAFYEADYPPVVFPLTTSAAASAAVISP